MNTENTAEQQHFTEGDGTASEMVSQPSASGMTCVLVVVEDLFFPPSQKNGYAPGSSRGVAL